MIGVLALIILGPERLPGVARTAGAWVGKARRMMRDIKADIKSELDEAELSELKAMRDDIQQAGESFKSQIEDGQEKLSTEGSAMDTAIASALNKPALDTEPEKNNADNEQQVAKKKKKKKAKKKVSKSKAKKKTASKKVADKSAENSDTEISS